jgi:hypothetical protein
MLRPFPAVVYRDSDSRTNAGIDDVCDTKLMPNRSSNKTPYDLNRLAAFLVDEATNEDPPEDDGKNPAAVALGRLGGAKGGPARAKALTPERRREIAQQAAAARWTRNEDGGE